MKYLKRQPKVFYFKQDTISSDKKWIVQVKHGSHIIRQDRHGIPVKGRCPVKKEVRIAETELYRQIMNEEYATLMGHFCMLASRSSSCLKVGITK